MVRGGCGLVSTVHVDADGAQSEVASTVVHLSPSHAALISLFIVFLSLSLCVHVNYGGSYVR